MLILCVSLLKLTLKSFIGDIEVTEPFSYTSDSNAHFVSFPLNFFNLPSPLPTNNISSNKHKLKTPLLLTFI